MRTLVLIGLLVFANSLCSQHGARFHALGANEANTDGNFALANNPGHRDRTGKAEGGTWLMNRFTGTRLTNGGIAAAFGFKSSAFGINASYAGTGEFNQNTLHFTGFQQFSKTFSAGFSAGIASISQGGTYANINSFSGKIGMNLLLDSRWNAACVIINPWNDEFIRTGASPAASVSIGYQANNTTRVSGQMRLDSRQNPVYGMAVISTFKGNFSLFGALQNGYEPVSAGIEWKRRQMKLAAATKYHVSLGFSPMFSLFWERK